MLIPHSINYNTFLNYKNTNNVESNRTVQSENFDWDQNHPKSLITLCIEKLSMDWKGEPKLESLIEKDRIFFLHILGTDIPLQILVDNISDDDFWARCYKSKWKDLPFISEENKWINVFMSRHFADYFENLNPRLYDPEKIMSIVELCGPFIKKLCIKSLIPSDIPVQRIVSPEMAELATTQQKCQTKLYDHNKEPLTRDHISLHAVLGSLSNLVEFSVTFQLKNVGVEYRKDQFQMTNNDTKNLGRGLEKCKNLKILRITRSDLNCQKLKYILRSVSESNHLETFDFSHCKIGDDGISSLAKYILRHENIRSLILVDNIFGPGGAENLSHALNHTSCGVRSLDLRLNDKLGSEGIAHIAVSLARGCSLTSLNISGCGIKSTPLTKPLTGVWSTTSAENPPTCGDLLARAIGLTKTPLRFLDISVNEIGAPSDKALANAVCLSHLIDINFKQSGMSSFSIAIAESAVAASRLRREAERGIKFRRSASKLVQARRVAKGMNIDADPILLAQQLSARPSIVSVTSEEGTYTLQPHFLPTEFGFIPLSLKSPLFSSRASSLTGPPTSRRSSHHGVLEPVMEVRRSALVRRGSDGSLLQSRHSNVERHIKIFVSNSQSDSD